MKGDGGRTSKLNHSSARLIAPAREITKSTNVSQIDLMKLSEVVISDLI